MGQRGRTDAGALRTGARGPERGRTVAFVVNGDASSAMADRARAFAARLDAAWRPEIAYRAGGRITGVAAFAGWLDALAPDVVYVLDMAVSGVLASAWHRGRRGPRVIVDTGDAITALARSGGDRGALGLAATAALERFSLWSADAIVVRGTFHRDLLAGRGIDATFIPDGVDLAKFKPTDGTAARRRIGLGDAFVVGLVGSSVWSPSLELAYGWDLVELVADLKALPVRGLLVGDGSGISRLRLRAEQLGIADRIVFAGRQPMDELPELLAACDVCLSTQTNDVPGNVRTTGKLPLYLACGRYVLASRVGEAARVLPPEMLVPYHDTVDREYPHRLAERVRTLVGDRQRLSLAARGPEIAREHFDYEMLARRVTAVLERVLPVGAIPHAASVPTK